MEVGARGQECFGSRLCKPNFTRRYDARKTVVQSRRAKLLALLRELAIGQDSKLKTAQGRQRWHNIGKGDPRGTVKPFIDGEEFIGSFRRYLESRPEQIEHACSSLFLHRNLALQISL